MERRNTNISYALWDVEVQTIDVEAIQKADYIINLAGAGVADKRWSAARKKEIVESRTKAGATIVKALETIPNKVKCVVNASAIGWYGADKKERLQKGFTEDTVADTEFLGDTCKRWEETIQPVTKLGVRLVKLRIGIVFSNNGGALVEFLKPLKWGLASILGNGKQIISWIHVEDLCRLFAYAIENIAMDGAYNAVSSVPVTNKDLTLTLAKIVKGKSYISAYVPSSVLKMMLGEMSIEVLKSATVNNHKVKALGFQFKFPTIELALKDLVEV
jgi:uncharacterized protein (TIGR01777 family)